VSHGAIQLVDVIEEVTGPALEELGVPNLWKHATGKGVKVAVFDSGIDEHHEDLEGAVKGSVNFTPDPDADAYGHGTHCAGIIGARRNGKGINGVAPDCDLYSVKVVDDHGGSMYEWLVQGFQWAIANQIDVVSCSIAGREYDERLEAVIHAVHGRGTIVVAAAGNFGFHVGEDSTGFPARLADVIGVGALTDDMTRAHFSSTGEGVNIMAPGTNILSTLPGNRYGITRGTSTAAPFVAGVVALMIHKLRRDSTKVTPDLIRSLIYLNAHDVGVPGKDKFTGMGIIKPEALLGSILRKSARFFRPPGR